MNFLRSCWILCILFNLLEKNNINAESTCPTIKLPNGRAKHASGGRLVNFKCKSNFELIGAKFAVCLLSGQWSQKVPTCVGSTCQRPVQQPNQIVEGLYKGGVLKYSCIGGLTRSGPERLFCDGEKWNDEPPKCTEATSIGCDFEKEDLCGWSQDLTDDFDWIWNKGETPTANTGPMFDHTTNSSEGHYLFMESSAPQKVGQKTRIISPPNAPEQMHNVCLQFYYHMFGPDGAEEVGDLDVYVRPQSLQMEQIDTAEKIFHVGGNQGDKWIRYDADIPPLSEPFNFVFQATRLNSWTGDIAIDDVKLITCLEKIATTRSPTPKISDDYDDTFTASSTPRRSTRRLPTRQQVTTSTTRRKQKQKTATRIPTSSKAPIKRNTVSNAKMGPTTSVGKLPKPTTVTTIVKTSVFNNNVESSTDLNISPDTREVSTQQWTSSMNKMTSILSPTILNLKTTDATGSKCTFDDNDCEVSYTNPDDIDDVNNDDNNIQNKSGDSKQGTPPSDYIDYTDIDSNGGRNRSAGINDSQTPFVDYDYNKVDSSGALSSSEIDLPIDGLLADVGSVKDEEAPTMTLPLLPLIIGIVASVLVGITVIAVLAWIWVRSQRQKQEKSHEDQMNIITEYVETNLSV